MSLCRSFARQFPATFSKPLPEASEIAQWAPQRSSQFLPLGRRRSCRAGRHHASETEGLAERQAVGRSHDLGQLPRVSQDLRDVVPRERRREEYPGSIAAYDANDHVGRVRSGASRERADGGRGPRPEALRVRCCPSGRWCPRKKPMLTLESPTRMGWSPVLAACPSSRGRCQGWRQTVNLDRQDGQEHLGNSRYDTLMRGTVLPARHLSPQREMGAGDRFGARFHRLWLRSEFAS